MRLKMWLMSYITQGQGEIIPSTYSIRNKRIQECICTCIGLHKGKRVTVS